MAELKKKLLLIRLSSLGDVIFNIPLANALTNNGYEVTWLVSEKGYDLLKDNACVNSVIFVPLEKWKKRGFCLENLKEYFSLIKELRTQKFDISIDSQMMFKSLIFSMFSGAKRRIVAKNCNELAFLGGNEFVDTIERKPTIPIVLHYYKYAQYLGINDKNIKVSQPNRTQYQIEKIDKFLSIFDNKKPLIVLAPATTWSNKHWNKDHWKAVVDEISDLCNIVFTGGLNDNDLIEYINQGRFLNLAGKTDLLELLELFTRADLVIAPDSGSAHLAWLSGKPKVITIFTCTPKNVLAPFGNNNKYIALGGNKLPCQPCFKHKCRNKDNKNTCTKYPTPEELVNNIKKILSMP